MWHMIQRNDLVPTNIQTSSINSLEASRKSLQKKQWQKKKAMIIIVSTVLYIFHNVNEVSLVKLLQTFSGICSVNN